MLRDTNSCVRSRPATMPPPGSRATGRAAARSCCAFDGDAEPGGDAPDHDRAPPGAARARRRGRGRRRPHVRRLRVPAPAAKSAGCAAGRGRCSCGACCRWSTRSAQVHEAGLGARRRQERQRAARCRRAGAARRLRQRSPRRRRRRGGRVAVFVSPERLDGAPRAPADDVYAFGVLLYELVSGHPPFYPDITPERVRDEAPAPLAGRPAPPEALRALVARCLAKSPAERPATMRDGPRRTRALPVARRASRAGRAPGFTPRPPADATPIRAQWQRSAAGAPSAARPAPRGLPPRAARRALRCSRSPASAFTFFVLPGLVASRTPGTTAGPAVDARRSRADRADRSRDLRAARRTEAAGRAAPRERCPSACASSSKRDVDSWGGATLAQARNALAAGDAAMDGREFDAALGTFRRRRRPLSTRSSSAHRRCCASGCRGARRLSTRDARPRRRSSSRPCSRSTRRMPRRRTGLARSQVLDAVLRETAGRRTGRTGGRYGRRRGGVPARAEARSRHARPRATDLARLQARAAGDAYSAAIARAQAALARQDHVAAQAAFEQAGRIRPGTPEVAEGLQQVRRATETRALASTLERAAAAERAERWSEALAPAPRGAQAEPTLVAGTAGRRARRAPRDARRRTAVLPRPAGAPVQPRGPRHRAQRARARRAA